MEHVSLILVRNPFDPAGSREFHTLPHIPGQTVPDYLQTLAPAEEYAISLNGGILPFESVPLTIPCPGDQLVAVPVQQGGDTGKTIALLAVMVVAVIVSAGALAPVLGPAFGAGMTGAAIAGGVIALGGSILISALTPTPKTDLPDISGLNSTSNTYGWNGPSLLAQQGLPISVLYGKHRITGNVIDSHGAADLVLTLGEPL